MCCTAAPAARPARCARARRSSPSVYTAMRSTSTGCGCRSCSPTLRTTEHRAKHNVKSSSCRRDCKAQQTGANVRCAAAAASTAGTKAPRSSCAAWPCCAARQCRALEAALCGARMWRAQCLSRARLRALGLCHNTRYECHSATRLALSMACRPAQRSGVSATSTFGTSTATEPAICAAASAVPPAP